MHINIKYFTLCSLVLLGVLNKQVTASVARLQITHLEGQTDRDGWKVFKLNEDTIAIDIRDIEMLSPQSVWAVGKNEEGGLILYWNGTSWDPIEHPGTEFLNAVDFLGEESGWAVGTCNEIIHFDGISWHIQHEYECQGAFIQSLTDVSMFTASLGLAVGSGCFACGDPAYLWNGTDWLLQDPTDYPSSISYINESSAWGVNSGTLVEWNGKSWVGHDEINGIREVWVSDDDGWAFGDKAFRWNGSVWEPYEFPIIGEHSLSLLSVTSENTGWVVEDSPQGDAIWKWDGTTWSLLRCFPDTSIDALSSIVDGEGWVIASQRTDSGYWSDFLLQYNAELAKPNQDCDGFNSLFTVTNVLIPDVVEPNKPFYLAVTLQNEGTMRLNDIRIDVEVDSNRLESFPLENLDPKETRTLEIPVLLYTSGVSQIKLTTFLRSQALDEQWIEVIAQAPEDVAQIFVEPTVSASGTPSLGINPTTPNNMAEFPSTEGAEVELLATESNALLGRLVIIGPLLVVVIIATIMIVSKRNTGR